MIGINNIGIHIPTPREDNYLKMNKFKVNKDFIDNKIGFQRLARKPKSESASSMCVRAFKDLTRYQAIDTGTVDFICVCTQNGDYSLPHTSCIVQDKLHISTGAAVFDISLGCSGYVYSLHIAKSFMEQNDCTNGLLFTADPYSDIVSSQDKNTSLLFGDAATVTHLTKQPILNIKKAVFNTYGNKHQALIKKDNSKLHMSGHSILNFCMQHLPDSIQNCIKKNGIKDDEIDLFLMHQASKYVISKLSEKLSKSYPSIKQKMPFFASHYGNTVSSSIPIVLKDIIHDPHYKHILLSGFGVGLSTATSIISRNVK